MRLVTRPDFDGLACAVLLEEVGVIDEYSFVHPKDIQDGKIKVDENDVLANVPYAPGCGMWFDHHFSEMERLKTESLESGIDFGYGSLSRANRGVCYLSPSCARVIYNFYYGPKEFKKFDDQGFMAAIDKCDQADFLKEDIIKPEGWVLLSFIIDVRTGLGRYKDFRIDHLEFMRDMIKYCRTMTIDQILEIEDVKERIQRYFEDETAYKKMLKKNTRTDKNVIIIDLRAVTEIKSGNRFIEYALHPDQNVSVRVFPGIKDNIIFSVGHSIINKTCTTDVGSLMLKYGGGGHLKAATCQIMPEQADQTLKEICQTLNLD